jgi:type II secretory pathway pseudopilin PulG
MIMMQGGNMPPELFQTLSLWPIVARHMGRTATSVSAQPSALNMEVYSDSGVEVLASTGVGPVLAAIAVPNFLEAQVRARVSRTRADMRSMATAIESYFVDYNAYPMSTIGSAADSASSASPLLDSMPTLSVNQSLSTPIAYITCHFPDVFIDQDPGLSTFSYYSDRRGWILVSPGPDRDFDLNPLGVYTSDVPQPSPELLQFAFDPTNGTISSGDIFRVRQ